MVNKKKVVIEFSKERFKFNKNIFLSVFLILLILFIIVFSAITFFDNYKRKIIEDDYNILQQQIILDDLYKSYLLDSSSNKCDVLVSQLDSYLRVNDELYSRLKKINKNAIVESDDNTKLLFVLTNIKLWFHYNTIEKECGVLDGKSVLYFYPEFKEFSVEKAKSDAETVVFVEKLGRFVNNCNFNSIALPYGSNIPILNQLIIDYNITSAPSIYYNGKAYTNIDKDSEFLIDINCNK